MRQAKMMRLVTLLMVLAMTVCCLSVVADGVSAGAAPLPLTVAVYDPCGGCASAPSGCGDCKTIDNFIQRLGQLLKADMDAGRVALKMLNLRQPDELAAYQQLCSDFGLDRNDLVLPKYFVGPPDIGQALTGMMSEDQLPGIVSRLLPLWAEKTPAVTPEPVNEETPEPVDTDENADDSAVVEEEDDLLVPRSDPIDDIGPTDSVVVYFFKDFCPYCKDLKPLFEALPNWLTLPDGTRSRLRFVSLEKQDPAQMAIVQRYYDDLKVTEDRQYVPMIVIGSHALFLKDEIVPQLLPLLFEGEGLKTDRAPLEALLESSVE